MANEGVRITLAVELILCALKVSFGCTTDIDCPLSGICDKDNACATSCTTDSCASGYYCAANGECTTRCSTDNDCKSTEICSVGECHFRCSSTSPCDTGAYCGEDSTCYKNCVEDSCPSDIIDGNNVTGVCNKADGRCYTRCPQIPCPTNSYCVVDAADGTVGICQEYMSCQEQHECNAGFYCGDTTAGMNICLKMCVRNSDCGESMLEGELVDAVCSAVDGKCYNRCGAISCAHGFYCDPRSDICYPKCATNSDCFNSSFACDKSDGKCYPRCTSISCTSGLVCNADGICVPKCGGSEKCLEDEVCNNGTGLCYPRCAKNTCNSTSFCGEGGLCLLKCQTDKDCPELGVCNVAEGKCQNASVPGTGGFPPPPPNSSDISVIAIAGVSAAVLLLLVGIAGFFCFFLKRRRRKKGGELPEPFDGLKVYSFAALRAATSDFRDVLGGGGSAEVFRAELDGRLVAVKKLKEGEAHRRSAQEFTTEARSLGQLLHMNLVRLLGYSSDPNRPKMLVYEFVEGGSLESFLYGNKKGLPSTPLPFDRRMEIALGVARGIEYCHHSIEPALVHRDIKPSNILMTSNDERGVPKVADFGLARILDPTDKAMATLIIDPIQRQDPSQENADSMQSNNQSYPSTQSTISVGPPAFSSSGDTTMRLPGALCTTIAGTFGYIDPEYLMTGRATLKSDVFSFGIVLLELIMGVRPMHIHAHLQELVIQDTPNEDPEDVNTASYDYALGLLLGLGEGEAVSRVINILGQKDINAHQCFEALTIARQCLQEKGKLRPPMRQVVRLMEQLNEGQAKG